MNKEFWKHCRPVRECPQYSRSEFTNEKGEKVVYCKGCILKCKYNIILRDIK